MKTESKSRVCSVCVICLCFLVVAAYKILATLIKCQGIKVQLRCLYPNLSVDISYMQCNCYIQAFTECPLFLYRWSTRCRHYDRGQVHREFPGMYTRDISTRPGTLQSSRGHSRWIQCTAVQQLNLYYHSPVIQYCHVLSTFLYMWSNLIKIKSSKTTKS